MSSSWPSRARQRTEHRAARFGNTNRWLLHLIFAGMLVFILLWPALRAVLS